MVVTMHTALKNVTNGLGGAAHALTNQQSHGRNSNLIQLIISNLEPSVSLSEWRRMLIVHVQAVIQNTFQLQVMRQPESGCFAIVKVSTMEDAQIVISHLNRRKIGYRRIRVGFLSPNVQNERHNQKPFISSQSTQQRFQYSTKMHVMRPQPEISQYNKKKDDKTGYIVPSKVLTGVCVWLIVNAVTSFFCFQRMSNQIFITNLLKSVDCLDRIIITVFC